jgi:hypothetical protein
MAEMSQRFRASYVRKAYIATGLTTLYLKFIFFDVTIVPELRTPLIAKFEAVFKNPLTRVRCICVL